MKIEKATSRRRFLERSSEAGGLIVSGEFSPVFAQDERARPEDQVLGPFYPITFLTGTLTGDITSRRPTVILTSRAALKR